MSHLRVSDIKYSDVIDSFISEILKYESSVIVSSTVHKTLGHTIHTIKNALSLGIAEVEQ